MHVCFLFIFLFLLCLFTLFSVQWWCKNLVLDLISATWSKFLSGFHLSWILVSFLTASFVECLYISWVHSFLVCSVLPCAGPDESWHEIYCPFKQFLPLFPSCLQNQRSMVLCTFRLLKFQVLFQVRLEFWKCLWIVNWLAGHSKEWLLLEKN